MSPRIVIIGSTGKLGSKLLSYTNKNNISIFAITCFSNKKKILNQSKKYRIKNTFTLSDPSEQNDFFSFLKSKLKIIYFLDYGSKSLSYLNIFLKFNSNSIIAIANKEMIIAGGKLLQTNINKTNNTLVPLDSEHFSLKNLNFRNHNIYKVYITASGGPFYFNKKIDINNVSNKEVLSHPKWNMGFNNLIDSSNFINKILEIFELSYIYDIELKKIDFYVSKEAYLHSIVRFTDSTVTFNGFNNNMLIPLAYPLSLFYPVKVVDRSIKYLTTSNLELEKPYDKRFVFFKYYKKIKLLNHKEQINLMLLNNYAHKLYLSNKLKYNKIISYIMSNVSIGIDNKPFKSFAEVEKYIVNFNKKLKTK